MKRRVLVTGGGGFLGSELTKCMDPLNESEFFLLYRSEKSKEKLQQIFQDRKEDVKYIQGDVTNPLESIPTRIDEVWHLAASTEFQESKRREIEITNLIGTKNVVNAAQRKGAKIFYYMSTAYVCGKEQCTIPENSFINTCGWKNPYEESKYFGEKMVKCSGLPYVIIRPSIIIGDSKTGDSKGENRMFYGHVLALHRTALHQFGNKGKFKEYWLNNNGNGLRNVEFSLPGDGRTTKNVVTLDDVVNVCLAIRNQDENAIGKTYNVVNAREITMGESTEIISKALKIKGITFDSELNGSKAREKGVLQKVAMRYTTQFHHYYKIAEPNWKTDNVDSLGVERVSMTPDLFNFMMDSYIKKEIIG